MVHFVLIHGLCHGAWCWYKLKPLLESAGHRVSAIDLAASGINMAKIEEVHTFSDYTQPLIELMDSLPPGENVTLVGHSMGGFSLALAMDLFPQKIAVAVFLAASMPDCSHSPSYVRDQMAQRQPAGNYLDGSRSSDLGPVNPESVMLFSSKMMALKLYQLCSSEDLALAELLIRPGSRYQEDLSTMKAFSKEGFGSVNRVYIVCKKDLILREDSQLWMIENNPPKEVMEIEDADHMAMLSKPHELCRCLLEVASKYN